METLAIRVLVSQRAQGGPVEPPPARLDPHLTLSHSLFVDGSLQTGCQSFHRTSARRTLSLERHQISCAARGTEASDTTTPLCSDGPARPTPSTRRHARDLPTTKTSLSHPRHCRPDPCERVGTCSEDTGDIVKVCAPRIASCLSKNDKTSRPRDVSPRTRPDEALRDPSRRTRRKESTTSGGPGIRDRGRSGVRLGTKVVIVEDGEWEGGECSSEHY